MKCCKCRGKHLTHFEKIKKDNDLYFKARKKYYEELDIIQILKKINAGHQFRSLMLNN